MERKHNGLHILRRERSPNLSRAWSQALRIVKEAYRMSVGFGCRDALRIFRRL